MTRRRRTARDEPDAGRKLVIIHPPVSPFSPREKIEAWVRELEAMRAEAAGDRDVIESVDIELEMARGWLRETDE